MTTHLSGSPIIQDGKLACAVTHVLVNDPTTGYGILIENMLDEMFMPIPMGEKNHIKKYDCEYVRKGSCSIFMFTEPLGQWREAHALPHRTCEDWARQMKWLIDEVYSDAEKLSW